MEVLRSLSSEKLKMFSKFQRGTSNDSPRPKSVNFQDLEGEKNPWIIQKAKEM